MRLALPRLLRSALALGLAVVLGGSLMEPAHARVREDVHLAGLTADDGLPDLYIVRLAAPPVTEYTGGVEGIPATAPTRSRRVDARSAAVRKYAAHLEGVQADLARRVGTTRTATYSFAFNGFAAQLTSRQVTALRKSPEVASVARNEVLRLDTSNTPSWLGLSQSPSGVWATQGEKGEDVVVGIIDSGIWPESPSFALANKESGYTYGELDGWDSADCMAGESWLASFCNGKIIGAKYYTGGFGGARGINRLFRTEYISARDADGHGTHTASTAAGHRVTGVSVAGGSYSVGGMAPSARIAVYKACWGTSEGAAGCPTVDTIAAINDAAADGVDVINFSISGSRNSLDDVEMAFRGAAANGVFIAASAGNSGPEASTVAHNSPWVTTVAAGTHRTFTKSVALVGGSTYQGVGLAAAVSQAPIVRSVDVKTRSSSLQAASLCYPRTLDSRKTAGKIVVCDRGSNPRVEKSAVVADAGGVGMILANVAEDNDSLSADIHSVPTVHLRKVDGDALKTQLGPLTQATLSASTEAPVASMGAVEAADFSSRGPALAGDGNLLKPDIIAPGVDVLAAVSPPGNGGRSYDFYSGTSMSSPHIAGLAALIVGKHGDWSPMAVKSAMMTTAVPLTAGDAFGYGAGHVKPADMFDVPAVITSTSTDWAQYICDVEGECPGLTPGAPYRLNTPSIAVASVAGPVQVIRTIRNVSGSTQTFAATASAPSGFAVTASPSSVSLNDGQSAAITITISRTSASAGEWKHGAISWSTGSKAIRIPIVAQAVEIAAATSLTSTASTGNVSFDTKVGFTGSYQPTTSGLKASIRATGIVTADRDGEFTTEDVGSRSVFTQQYAVGAGRSVIRFATFDADTPSCASGTDIDVYVYGPDGNPVAESAGGSCEESVTLFLPEEGTYTVHVHGWAVSGPRANVTLHSWTGSDSAGASSVTLTPSSSTSVSAGDVVSITASWSGAATSTRWLAVIEHRKGGVVVSVTLLSVTPT